MIRTRRENSPEHTEEGLADLPGGRSAFLASTASAILLVATILLVGGGHEIPRPVYGSTTFEVSPRVPVESNSRGDFRWLTTATIEIVVTNNLNFPRTVDVSFRLAAPPDCPGPRTVVLSHDSTIERRSFQVSDGIRYSTSLSIGSESFSRVAIDVDGAPCVLGPNDPRRAYARIDSLEVS